MLPHFGEVEHLLAPGGLFLASGVRLKSKGLSVAPWSDCILPLKGEKYSSMVQLARVP